MSTSGGAKAKTRAPQHYSDEVVLTCAVLGTSTVLRVVVDPSIIVHELMVKLYDREEIRAHCSAAEELALFLATSLNATRGETDKLSPGERIQERFPQGYPPVDVVAILVKLPTKPSSPGEPDSVEHDTHDSTPFQLETGDEEPDGDDRHGSRTRMLLVTGAVCCVIGLHVTIWTHYTAADIERAFILIGMSEANLEGAVMTHQKMFAWPNTATDSNSTTAAFLTLGAPSSLEESPVDSLAVSSSPSAASSSRGIPSSRRLVLVSIASWLGSNARSRILRSSDPIKSENETDSDPVGSESELVHSKPSALVITRPTESMGLRSRQRRRAGVDTAASFDIETLQHRGVSLEEHLQASRRDIDDFNFAWKHAVAIAGLLLALYELALLYQVVFVPRHAASSLVLCVLFKLLAVASLLSTRAYIQTGASASLGASGFFTAAYVLVYVCCVLVLGLSFSLVQVSPIAVVYCVVSHTALRLIGDNTKAEVARAQQLQKLEQLASQGKL